MGCVTTVEDERTIVVDLWDEIHGALGELERAMSNPDVERNSANQARHEVERSLERVNMALAVIGDNEDDKTVREWEHMPS